MKIIIPGGSGYLGHALSSDLAERGHEAVVLARRDTKIAGARVVRWDGATLGEWANELDGASAVVNLAGRSVNCRYTARNKREIYESRLRSTRAVGEAIAACRVPPPIWLNASSATIYRHAEDRTMDEVRGDMGHGFSVDVCQQWEAEFERARVPEGVRKVALRTAMVFGPPLEGTMGVYEAFARLIKMGMGGSMGRGTQFVSWVHVADFCRAVEWLVAHEGCAGAFNITAPHPLRNYEFMRVMRRGLGARVGIAASEIMLKVGALVMGTETELLLKSRRVVPARLLETGFEFEYRHWAEALGTIVAAERNPNVSSAME